MAEKVAVILQEWPARNLAGAVDVGASGGAAGDRDAAADAPDTGAAEVLGFEFGLLVAVAHTL